jgi:DNA polymerase-3 subunit delta
MLKNNEDSIKILSILADQFVIIYKTKELYKKGHTEKDIVSILDIHPYRVQKALEKGRRYESSAILNYIEKLADLDNDIKSGKIDKDLGLELFILNV